MGSASSKVTRKLPREKPSWTGSHASPVSNVEPAAPLRPKNPLAFENKNEVIEKDAKDPHFMEKLNQLGPVRVDHRMQTVRAVSNIQNMYRSRVLSEAQAQETAGSQSVRNRLLASSLTDLLDARKTTTNSAELVTLARRHHVDAETLKRLTRIVNTPSVDESTIVRTTDRHGEESLTMKARWIDPVSCRV